MRGFHGAGIYLKQPFAHCHTPSWCGQGSSTMGCQNGVWTRPRHLEMTPLDHSLGPSRRSQVTKAPVRFQNGNNAGTILQHRGVASLRRCVVASLRCAGSWVAREDDSRDVIRQSLSAMVISIAIVKLRKGNHKNCVLPCFPPFFFDLNQFGEA